MKHKTALIILLMLSINPSYTTSLNFLNRGGQHCTGYCNKEKINCTKGVDQQGFHDWCEKYCAHKYSDALTYCNTKNAKIVNHSQRVTVEPKKNAITSSGELRASNSLLEDRKSRLQKVMDFREFGLNEDATEHELEKAYKEHLVKARQEHRKDTEEEITLIYQSLKGKYFPS